ncbi:hypothetical protein, partial [Streptomyces minutiscleroticus]|uniref:hypothetical protein n=1 Tax=Streptomyces minutiscleroticus TaxID=68238 RepID=UPI003332B1A3
TPAAASGGIPVDARGRPGDPDRPRPALVRVYSRNRSSASPGPSSGEVVPQRQDGGPAAMASLAASLGDAVLTSSISAPPGW